MLASRALYSWSFGVSCTLGLYGAGLMSASLIIWVFILSRASPFLKNANKKRGALASRFWPVFNYQNRLTCSQTGPGAAVAPPACLMKMS